MLIYKHYLQKNKHSDHIVIYKIKKEKCLTKILYRFPSSSASIFIAFAPGTLFFEKEKLISNIHNLLIFLHDKGKSLKVI